MPSRAEAQGSLASIATEVIEPVNVLGCHWPTSVSLESTKNDTKSDGNLNLLSYALEHGDIVHL